MCMGRLRVWTVVLLFLGCSSVLAHAGATLLLEEPYSYDGTFAGTGHVAVYLSRVCADSPLLLRRCEPGEKGSRPQPLPRELANTTGWRSRCSPTCMPSTLRKRCRLYADAKLEAFLRDRYRRKYLAAIAPDVNNGETPEVRGSSW